MSGFPLKIIYGLFSLLLSLVITCSASNIYVPGLPETHYRQLGQINLGVLLPIHEYNNTGFCGQKIADFMVMQRIEAINAAIEEVNERTDILPDHKLGFIMYDDCHKGITALAQTLHFIEDTEYRSEHCIVAVPEFCTNGSVSTYDIVGLIASENSVTTAQIANMFTSFRIPQISYLATAEGFTSGARYPYFRRTLPPDTYQARAIVALMHHFQWTYVSVLYSEGEYGNQGYKALHEEAQRSRVCLVKAKEIPLNWGLGMYQRLMLSLLLRKKSSIVVAILSRSQSMLLLEAAERMNVDGRITWVATNAWARHRRDLGKRINAALGGFSVQIETPKVPRFNDLYKSRDWKTSSNPWMPEYLEAFFNCTSKNSDNSTELRLKRCSPDLRLHHHPDYVPDSAVPMIYDTVYTYARALNLALHSPVCSEEDTLSRVHCATSTFPAHLRNVSFMGEGEVEVSFKRRRSVLRPYVIYNIQNRTGDWQMVDVARYDPWKRKLDFTANEIQWSRGEQPTSMCSKPCNKGHAQFVIGTMCCWMCEPCAPNQYTRPVWGLQQCFTCNPGTRPDPETRTKCQRIIPTYMKWHEPLAIIIATSVSIGLLVCGATLIIFILNNNHPLVKASSRELSYLLLASVSLSYAFCFCFIVKPSKTVCFLRLLGLSICFTLMYGPMVIKTTRIYRIFEAGRMMNRKPTCVTSKSQIGIVLGIELFHVCIIAMWSVITHPRVREVVASDTSLELMCDFPPGPFITSLSYNVLLLIASVYCAFKTRKLPDNFSESKFIGFCVYSTVVIWLAFIPAYFTVPSAFYQTMLLSLAVLLNGTLILACIFFPKIYAIYRVAQSQQHLSQTFRAIRGVKRFRTRTFNEDLEQKIESTNQAATAAAATSNDPDQASTLESHFTARSGNTQTPSGGEKLGTDEATRGGCGDDSATTSTESLHNQPAEHSEYMEEEQAVKPVANGFKFVVK